MCIVQAISNRTNAVNSNGEMISGRLDGERSSVHGKVLDSTICLSCLPDFSVQLLIYSSALSLRVQHRGRIKVVWSQLAPSWCRDPVRVSCYLSPRTTSGRTTPTLAGAGSRSQILGKGHRRRGQALVRNLVVLVVRAIC